MVVVAMLTHCKGGKMRSKKDKRKNGKNKQQEYLDQYED
jgi:hypothetical protein